MKTRIVTGILLLLFIVPIVYLGGIFFQIGMLILGALSFKEMLDLKKTHDKIPPMMCLSGLMAMFLIILSNNSRASVYYGVNYGYVALIILLLLIPIIFYDKEYTVKEAFYLIGTVLFIGYTFNTFIMVRNRDVYTFVFLAMIPVLNDIFAFLVGSKIGKHKITKISPNKSWEGSIAGLLVGTGCSLLFYGLLIGRITFTLVLMVVAMSIAGQIGDLVFSKIKRENDIKDFSNILPGHGGILDRLDSIVFVFITYIVLISI